MKQVLLKTIVIVMCKLTRSRVLRDGTSSAPPHCHPYSELSERTINPPISNICYT